MLLAVAVVPLRAAEDAAETVSFNRDIRPILSNNCFQCHGPDEVTRERGLRFDVREAALAHESKGVAAIVPGDAAGSLIMQRITHEDPSRQMPPPELNKTLTDEQIDLLTRWIDQGAEYEEHWTFIAPQRPRVPEVDGDEWAVNAIDHFILERLESEGLSPSAEADRRTLIRRVSFDLTGIGPTPQQVQDFLDDKAPGAYERLVDRLLASPRYGEHMARFWLDAARYADTHGYQYDTERTQWRWRDWVIDAYNSNMPFDQFTIEQLAGDLLPNPTMEQRLATAFNRNHPITIEGGVIEEEYRIEYVLDRVTTTGTVWLGMTFNCARCHDHKYDPIEQRELFQLMDFFNHVPERGSHEFKPLMATPTKEQSQQLTEIDAQIALKRDRLVKDGAQVDRAIARWRVESQQDDWTVHRPASFSSANGATLLRMADNSVLVGGAVPDNDVHEVVIHLDEREVRGIRLEALTHESLPHEGAGLAHNSNFVLSEFEATIAPRNRPHDAKAVTFRSATADHSQEGYDIAKAIDGQGGSSGWAVEGNAHRVNRTAWFVTDEPIGHEGGAVLRLRMRYEFGSKHTIGRFRLATSMSGASTTPPEVLALLKASPQDEAERDRQRQAFLQYVAEPKLREKYDVAALQAQRKAIEDTVVQTMVMEDMAERRDTFLLIRGEYDKPGEKVTADVPAALPPLPDDAPRNRLGLARWIVSDENPLTARVAVNRYWQRYFGTGIVETVEDFGSQSPWPSHMKLIDWLAVEFRESGWDVKAMQKLIVMSATYRQSSVTTPQLLERDPANRLLARGPRLRLSGEAIRDQALAASGLLVEQIGGPSVYPYQPDGLWQELNNRPGYSDEWGNGTGDSLYRRSLYTFWKRTVPYPALATFDAPNREVCVIKRGNTNTPLQALVLLHDPQYIEAARHLARRMMQAETADASRIAFGFEQVTARPPTAEETRVLHALYQQQLSVYRSDGEAARRVLEVGDSPRDETLDTAKHAAWTIVARAMFNLDEAVTKN